MKVTASAISLNVADVSVSAEFVKQHFGFVERIIVQLVEWVKQP